jgi:hypothetical protein
MPDQEQDETLPVAAPQDVATAEQFLARLAHSEARLAEEEAALHRWAFRLSQRKAKIADAWEELRRGMVTHGINTVWTPTLTVSLVKGRKSLKVLDEARCIAICEARYPAAVKVEKSLLKKPLQVAVDSLPKEFAGLVQEVPGEPTLRKTKKEDGNEF